MNPDSIETKAPASRKQGLRSPLILTAVVLGGGFLLWNTLFAGQPSSLLWLLLLACPLMHFLMPHGHGGAKGSGNPGDSDAGPPPEPPAPSSTGQH